METVRRRRLIATGADNARGVSRAGAPVDSDEPSRVSGRVLPDPAADAARLARRPNSRGAPGPGRVHEWFLGRRRSRPGPCQVPAAPAAPAPRGARGGVSLFHCTTHTPFPGLGGHPGPEDANECRLSGLPGTPRPSPAQALPPAHRACNESSAGADAADAPAPGPEKGTFMFFRPGWVAWAGGRVAATSPPGRGGPPFAAPRRRCRTAGTAPHTGATRRPRRPSSAH